MSFSCDSSQVELKVTQGKTLYREFRWAQSVYTYKAISAIAATAPIRLTVTSHGIPDGWQFAISGVVGPTSLNALTDPPTQDDMFFATVVDANTIDINKVNGSLLQAYVSGGHIQYLTPVDLTGYNARMQIRLKKGGSVLWSGNSVDGELSVSDPLKLITARVPPTDTAALDPGRYVFEIEMYNGTDVYTLVEGSVAVYEEVIDDV